MSCTCTGPGQRKQQAPEDPDEQIEQELAKCPCSKGQQQVEGSHPVPLCSTSETISDMRFWAAQYKTDINSLEWVQQDGTGQKATDILEHEKFQLDIRKNVFTMRSSNTKTGCLQRLGVLHLWEYSNLKGGGSKWGLHQKFLEIPSNSSYFMILWSITFFITPKQNKVKILAYKTFPITLFITNYSGQL